MDLSEYLESKQESESQFARRAGIPQQTLNRIARGSCIPLADAVYLIQVATAGLVRVEDILTTAGYLDAK